MADSILRLRVESQEYDNKLKQATQGLTRYADECRKVGGTLEVVEKETLDYVRALGQMDTTSRTATGKLAEMKKTFTELSVVYKNMTDEEKNSPFGKALAQSLDQLKVRINETKADLNSVTSELNGSKFGQFGSVIDTIGQKMGITGNLTEMLTSKTALMTTAIGAGAAAAGKAAEMWASYNSELAKQDQVVTVTTGLKDGDAERMTDAVRAIANTYNVDFREAVNAANTLMTQFGKTGDEAIQLLRDGMQGMIQGDGGKLLSMIQQYAPSFRDAGIEASQLVAIIQNSEGGLFTDQNMNAIVMGIKNIRLMTNATSEALQKIGIDSEEMTQKLNSGSMTIFDAMRQVSNAIENTGSSSQAAGEVMQQVFGRQGAMAGTKLGEAIASLNTNLEETKTQTGELGNAYRDLEIANENLNKAIRDCFEYDGWEVMKTEIETGLVNALSDVLNSCRSLYGMLEDIGALKVFEFISGSILQCIRPFRELYNYAKLLFDELGGGTDAPKPKAGVRNLADDPNVDDNGNYKVKNVKNKNKKRLVSKPGEPVRYEGSTAPVDTGANPVKPLKPRRTAISSGSRSNTKKEQTELQQNQKLINDLVQQYVALAASGADGIDEQTKKIREQIKQLEKRNSLLKLYEEQAHGRLMGAGGSLSTEGISKNGGMLTGAPTQTMYDIVREKGGQLLSNDAQKAVNMEIEKGNESALSYAKKQLAVADTMAGNLGNILSGLTKMGIELPEGLSAIVEGTQSIISIVTSIMTLVSIISTLTAVKSTPIVGWLLANGGIAGGARGRRPIHAATGTIVPGNNYSGDRVPALVNSGELILNRAQQGNIASQLQGGGMQNMNLQAIVTGEQLRFILNTNSRRRGKGEYVTSTHQ